MTAFKIHYDRFWSRSTTAKAAPHDVTFTSSTGVGGGALGLTSVDHAVGTMKALQAKERREGLTVVRPPIER